MESTSPRFLPFQEKATGHKGVFDSVTGKSAGFSERTNVRAVANNLNSGGENYFVWWIWT